MGPMLNAHSEINTAVHGPYPPTYISEAAVKCAVLRATGIRWPYAQCQFRLSSSPQRFPVDLHIDAHFATVIGLSYLVQTTQEEPVH